MDVGTVKGSRVALNRDGTKPVMLLDVEITDVDDVQTVELFTSAGEDYNPPIGSSVFVTKSGNSWKIAVACDDGVAPVSNQGERIIYASAAGVIVGQVYLKADGSIEVSNAAGNFKLEASGQVNINNGNFTVDP